MSRFDVESNIIERLINLYSQAKAEQPNLTDTEIGEQYEAVGEIKSFLDEIPCGFFIYSASGDEDILYANAALIRIFGCDSLREFKALTHGSFKGIVHPDDLAEVEKSTVAQIFNSQSTSDFVEYRIVRKDGAVRWVEDYGHFIKSASTGNIFYVFLADITEKKERELAEKAALIAQKRDREQTIKTLVETYDRERKLITKEQLRRLEVIEGLSENYDTIIYVDFEAETVFPYRQGNRVFRQFEGVSRPRELNWYFDDYANNIVFPEDRERIRELTNPAYMREKLSTCKSYYANFIGGVNGIRQHLQIRIVNVGTSENGMVSQAVVGYRNIDDEVKHETEQMLALEDALKIAKQAEIAKTTFLSNMSHDLRTPLNALFGYMMLAQKRATDPELLGYLDKIYDASKQMFDLINKLLEISYIESREIKIKERECNIVDIVNNAYDEVLSAACKKEIACTVRCTDIRHAEVLADGDKIKQVLSYILSNAVNYTPGGGKGKVSFVAEEVGTVTDGYATYRFTIKDNGIGIEKSKLSRIFMPFERGITTTDSGIIGIGLGLTISKNIIDMMDGIIKAESEEGKGSTFTVTLGLRISGNKTDKESDTDAIIARLKGKKILIVEDNEINREIITEILESYDFSIDTAENGQIALDKIIAESEDHYAFVLMDIQMPVLDGRAATREIRKLGGKKANLPIIAISANAFESDKRQSIEAGMDAHLNKPLDVSALMQTIAAVCEAKKIF